MPLEAMRRHCRCPPRFAAVRRMAARRGADVVQQAMSPVLPRACQVVALAALVANITILLGSLDFRTRWEVPGGYGYDHFLVLQL